MFPLVAKNVYKMAGVQWVEEEILAEQTEQAPNLPLTTPNKVWLVRAIGFRQEERWGGCGALGGTQPALKPQANHLRPCMIESLWREVESVTHTHCNEYEQTQNSWLEHMEHPEGKKAEIIPFSLLFAYPGPDSGAHWGLCSSLGPHFRSQWFPFQFYYQLNEFSVHISTCPSAVGLQHL